jgi:putative oxidoreductase
MTTTAMSGAVRRPAGKDWRRAGMWLLQSVTAAAFAAAGGAKLWGTSQAATLFETIDQALGLGQWLRYAVGVVEVVGAVALLDIDAAAFAAAALSFVTFGMLATHVLVVHTNPVVPLAMLAAVLLVAWVRRDELLVLVRRPELAPRKGDPA